MGDRNWLENDELCRRINTLHVKHLQPSRSSFDGRVTRPEGPAQPWPVPIRHRIPSRRDAGGEQPGNQHL